MKVRIVNYEEAYGIDGILSKYAYSMKRELDKIGVKCSVSARPTDEADINHHINYLAYQPSGKVDTLMITHLEGDANQSREYKLEFLKKAIVGSYGITFEHNMIEYLVSQGVPRGTLSCVLPAHDSIPRRPRVIAILTNIYPDGRKREGMYAELFRAIDKTKFFFKIMGTGWGEIIIKADIIGEITPKFDMEKYREILNTADYNLYVGNEDCQSQGVIDAKYAGIRNIAPNLSTFNEVGIEYPFETQEELNAIFKAMETTTVDDWTWENYTRQHLAIWEKLL